MIIIKKNKFITFRFMNWLLFYIRQNCLKNLNVIILKDRENKINELSVFGEEINLTKALRLILLNLKVRNFKDCYIITLNNFIFYPGTKIRLIDIYRVVTYGTLDIKPYPFIYNTLLEIKDNIKYYVKMYKSLFLE